MEDRSNFYELISKKVNHDQEIIQRNSISNPENPKGKKYINKFITVYERHAR